MGILDSLAQAKRPARDNNERTILPNGRLTIADDVFRFALMRLNLSDEIINDLMLEPAESREDWLEYYERHN